MEQDRDDLLRVCNLLNKHGARYLVAGAHACILHGLVRTTEDVDILIAEGEENYSAVIAALSELEDHAAEELTPKDFEDNIVIKVADEVEVDVSRRAWKVSYAEAEPSAQAVEIDGVKVPYLGIADLVRSKETMRDRDRADLLYLKRLMSNGRG